MEEMSSVEAGLPATSPPTTRTPTSPSTLPPSEQSRRDPDGTQGERDASDARVDDTELAASRAQSLAVGAIHRHYGKDLLETANNLQSICNVQDTSITLIEYKEKVLVELRESYQLEEILDEAQKYYDKLVSLKKEMVALSRKSKDLTRRAAHVKSVREKEKAKKEQERKRLERIEQDLAPRYASHLTL